jgi:tetratricopeptide (TPR) repeat protein/acyl carrier protein
MVPERVYVSSSLPRNRLGKVARGELPKLPAATPDADIVAGVVAIFARQLDRDDIDPDVRFFELGGDSLGSVNVLFEIEERFGVSVPPAAFGRASSATALAAYLAAHTSRQPAAERRGRLITVRGGNGRPPFVFAHGLGGTDFLGPLFDRLDLVPGHPLLSLQSAGAALLDGTTPELTAVTRPYAALIAGSGPAAAVVVGHSLGAHVAFATAASVLQSGVAVPFVAAFDDDAELRTRKPGIATRSLATRSLPGFFRQALDSTPVAPRPLHVVFVRAEEDDASYRWDPTGGWAEVALGGVTVAVMPGNHHSLVRTGTIESIAAVLGERLTTDGRPAAVVEPDDGRRLRYRARLACAQGDSGTEIAAYREAIALDREQPAWAYANLAEALIEVDAVDAGMAALDEALGRDRWPLSVDLRFVDGWVADGLDDRVAQALERAATLASDHPSVLEQRGRLARAAGLDEEAEALYRAGLAMAPRHLRLHLDLAMLLERQRRHAEAASLLAEANEQTPGLDVVVVRLARTLVRAGKPARAISLLDEMPGLRVHPAACLARGDALQAMGHDEEALAAFAEAAELRPTSARMAHQVALALERLGREGEAREWARRAAACADATPAMAHRASRLGP